MTTPPAVLCRGLGKTYRSQNVEVKAVTDLDLELPRRDFACLSGPSGSGKTTVLNLVGGLDRPTAGTVAVDGQSLGDLAKAELARLRLRKIGFVFQAFNLIPVLTARENIEFVMQVQGVSEAERRRKVDAILEEVGLAGLGGRRPGELSGGQQQRVAVARAIVSEPALVLADEPTANLDSSAAESLLKLLRHMNEEHGVTFLFSTHDPRVMEFSRRLITMRDGRVVKDERREKPVGGGK